MTELAHSQQRSAGLAFGSEIARTLFAALAERTADAPGVTRVSYGPGERIAFALMAEAATAWNAEIAFDVAGNQFITLAGLNRERTIYIGSHLDSVPHGGNYDGAAGVILGLALQAALAREGRRPPFDLTTLCLRAEESCWFSHSYIGSKTALGVLEPGILDSVRRADSGRSLADHMQEESFNPEAVRRGESRIERTRTLAYIEPHIEQGPVLMAKDLPLALVTGIRGSFRYRDARCIGQYSHSGATPRELRSDAVHATADLIVAMNETWEALERDGQDVVITFGIVGTDPAQHSFSKVAGETHICVDVRSQSVSTLDDVRRRLAETTGRIAAKRRVRFDLGAESGSRPALMSRDLLGLLVRACARAGVAAHTMTSGAGHDAATFALAGIPSSMLFIRNANGSHNPDETMAMPDFDRALAVLMAAMDEPAQSWLRLNNP